MAGTTVQKEIVTGASTGIGAVYTRETKASGMRFQAVLPGPTDTEMWARGDVPENMIPRSMIMNAEDLVEAALVGLDRGEILTLPTVTDESVWATCEADRQGLKTSLAAGQPAPRYRQPEHAAS